MSELLFRIWNDLRHKQWYDLARLVHHKRSKLFLIYRCSNKETQTNRKMIRKACLSLRFRYDCKDNEQTDVATIVRPTGNLTRLKCEYNWVRYLAAI